MPSYTIRSEFVSGNSCCVIFSYENKMASVGKLFNRTDGFRFAMTDDYVKAGISVSPAGVVMYDGRVRDGSPAELPPPPIWYNGRLNTYKGSKKLFIKDSNGVYKINLGIGEKIAANP